LALPRIRTAIYNDTYTHMKTTIEISDSLLDEAKRLAAKEGTTVRAYVEQGLRRIVAERKSRGLFRLRKAAFKGKGLQPGVQDATWERIREAIYQGRGG
jgi:Arc/MetJ family transcription regulator